MYVGKGEKRVDAPDKTDGRAKFTEDMIDPSAYVAKIVHSTIPHGIVTGFDLSEAEAMEGVVKIVTCFEVPDVTFPTDGHPWSTDPGHQGIRDRHLLNKHVRYVGDEVAVVIARDEVTAKRAARAVKVQYEELPAVFDTFEAMKEGAPTVQEMFPNNIIAHSTNNHGDYEKAIQEPGLTKVEGWYTNAPVSHAHMENGIVYSYIENGKVVVVASTQLPHIVRRIVGMALDIPWGDVRVIKPYIGGGFGNKQDALYEPLGAWLTTQVGGHPVVLNSTREETFTTTRTRHGIVQHVVSWVRPDGTFAARKLEEYSNGGAYAAHGHSITAKGLNCFHQLYPCDNVAGDAWTVYTNIETAGAMRGYGMPQSTFAIESHTDDVARAIGMDPLEFRMKNIMPKGYYDPKTHNCNYEDSYRDCLKLGAEKIGYYDKVKEYANQTGNIRRGIGVAAFWYNTGIYPITLEMSSCRMTVNQDGTIQLQMPDTEIGQGADTAFSQMAADAVGVKFSDIHITSQQDTDVLPFGTAAYASRQTFVASHAIKNTAEILRRKIIEKAHDYTEMQQSNLDLVDGNIIRKSDGKLMMTLAELSLRSTYDREDAEHLTAEATYQTRSNAYSVGCSFADVEIDMELCQVRKMKIVNVHDAGNIINPALAEAQCHGGMAMSVGYALSERLVFDPKDGHILNGNLLDYKLPTAMDAPEYEVYFVEHADPTSPFGTKSLGEPPTLSPAPAIRNAILQATGFGATQLPMTPEVLLKGFKEQGYFGDNEDAAN